MNSSQIETRNRFIDSKFITYLKDEPRKEENTKKSWRLLPGLNYTYIIDEQTLNIL